MPETACQSIFNAERLFFNRHYSTALEGDLHQDPDWPRTFPATQSAFEIGQFNILQRLGDLQGKRVLELGCGWGRLVTAILHRGGECDAIDLSDVAVELTKKRAIVSGFKHGYRLFCTSAENFVPPQDYYDYVVGEAILHHLQDYTLVGARIFDALKNNGKAIFVENVCHNPVINLLRKIKHRRMDPQKISPAEKDVDLDRDISQQLAQPFGGYHIEGQFMFYLAWRFTTNEALLRWCFMLDKMFSRSFVAKYYGIVLIELTKRERK